MKKLVYLFVMVAGMTLVSVNVMAQAKPKAACAKECKKTCDKAADKAACKKAK
jgi:hypothetical protein